MQIEKATAVPRIMVIIKMPLFALFYMCGMEGLEWWLEKPETGSPRVERPTLFLTSAALAVQERPSSRP
ncbi:MAG: hypothetical protein EOP84_10040 [Verrucomicrobiaceae bacterium]|nr:MAG: hypothetical protein EOP84_10040 [Verrucomicrobiaceae bacterium]